MGTVSGITFIKDARGKKRKMVIDLSKVSEEVQDLIDGIVSDLRLSEPVKEAKDVFKKLDKKFKSGTSRTKK